MCNNIAHDCIYGNSYSVSENSLNTIRNGEYSVDSNVLESAKIQGEVAKAENHVLESENNVLDISSNGETEESKNELAKKIIRATTPLTFSPDENQYYLNRNRFDFDERNQSQSLYASASQDLTTVRPYWQYPENYGFNLPYPASTDNGRFRFYHI